VINGAGSFGTSVPGDQAAPSAVEPAGRPAHVLSRGRPGGQPPGAARRPWTEKQEKLALIYNEQGLRPDEIADKLGVSTYTATQIVLAARNRAKR
jgi:hypothetical protein